MTRFNYTQEHAATIEAVTWFVAGLRYIHRGAFGCADFAFRISDAYADIALSYVEINEL